MEKQTVLITGANKGIGLETARQLANAGYHVFLGCRDKQRGEEAVSQLHSEGLTSVELVVIDVVDDQSVQQAYDELSQRIDHLDVLINNAGNAHGLDPIQTGNADDWDAMMDINVKGLLYVSKAVVPFMIKRKKGHIINLGSTAAKEAYEGGNTYCATKTAVDSLSKGMRIDLLRYHIKVTAIHPGAAETEFSMIRFKGSEEAARKVYEGFHPLSAEDVADIIFYTASLPPHVCINDLVVTCTQQANSFFTDRSGSI